MSVGPEVEVSVTPVSDTPDNVEVIVVNETQGDAPASDPVDAVVIATEIDLAQRVTRLEQIVFAEVIPDLVEAEFTADTALDIAEDAVSIAVEADAQIDEAEPVLTELAEESVEDEDNPGFLAMGEDEVKPDSAKRHWLFRSRDEWKGR